MAPPQGPGRPITVGVLSQDAYNSYVEPILDGLSSAARERGVRLVVFVEGMTPEDLLRSRRLTTSLASPATLDALLVLPLGHSLTSQDIADYCQSLGSLPICSVPDVTGDFCSRVNVDNEPGLRAGIRHLLEVHQYQRVAFVRGPRDSDEAEFRYRIYREELAAHGLALDPDLVADGQYIVQSGIDAVRRFWERSGPRPDAIVAANDGMALGALEELTRRGVAVPDDVALLGFDDIELARYVEPSLTTVRQPLRELGRRTLDVLLERVLQGTPAKRELMPSELVIRESCGCSPYRTTGSVSSVPEVAERGLAALGNRGAQAIFALRELRLSGVPESPWQEQLYAAFLEELSGAEHVFLPELQRLLEGVARSGGDVSAFHKLITLLWKFARRGLEPGSAEWWRADALLHAARVKTSGIAERAPARQQVRFEDAAYKLTSTSNALSSVVDQASLSRVLAMHLPEHLIHACYVCLYDDSPASPGYSRLVAGFEQGRPLELPEGGLRFDSGSVLPNGALGREPACWYFAGPLSRGETSPGYVVMQCGNALGFVFENLLVHLGAVQRRISLLEALVREATLREIAERQRMEKELAIAAEIQSGILPRQHGVSDLEIAAVMRPATEVGGDYYDVIPVPDGAFLGIGDVAGHGLPTGLVVLMLQSAIGALVRARSDQTPSEVLTMANGLLFENIHDRMRQNEYVTLTLLHYEEGGKLTFAGAHEDLIVYRALSHSVEVVQTEGIWLGAIRDARGKLPNTSIRLEPGDVLLLYTDGITEARNAAREFFGTERLAQALLQHGQQSPEAVRDAVLEAALTFADEQLDDMTVVVVRRRARMT
jgi:phosphoserine phosphatase RsbU/P